MKSFSSFFLWLLFWPAYSQSPTIAQLRTQLAQAKHDTTRLRLYRRLAVSYMPREQVDSLIFFSDKGLALAQRYHLEEQQSTFYLCKGFAYKRKALYSKAQALYLTALRVIESHQNSSQHSRLYYYLSSVYGDQGKYPKAIEAASKGLQIAEQVKDSVMVQSNCVLLVHAHLTVKNPSQALLYANKLLKLANQSAETSEIRTWAHLSIADIYEAMDNPAKAYPYLIQNLNAFQKQQSPALLSDISIRIGNNLINQKKPLLALDFVKKAAEKKWIDPKQELNSYYYKILASAYQQIGNYPLARHYARKGYQIAQKIKHPAQIQTALSTLQGIEEAQKNHRQALAYMRELNTINDSLFTIEKAKAVADVETRYQLAQKEQAIDLLRKAAALRKITLERDQQELTAQRQRQLMLISFVLLLVMGLTGLYVIFRREQTTLRLLADQKEDIEAKATQLQQLNALKDNLFSIIGHDLRSPLAALKTGLETLARKQVTITPAETSYVRMLNLTNTVYDTTDNLLSWSLLQRGGMQAWPNPLDLAIVAETVCQLYVTQLQAKQITLITHCEEAPVVADKDQLQIVARNLLHNAVKFTPAGGTIRLRTGKQANHSVLIIQDTGVGMVIDKQPTHDSVLINPKHRKLSGEAGTGIGLSICREFVRLNGGQLHIDSTPGKGTTVTVSF